MERLSILFLGVASGTTLHRARAMERLGHRVVHLSPRDLVPRNRYLSSWMHHTGALFLAGLIERRVRASLPAIGFDLVWVEGGELTTPKLISELRQRYGCVVSYNHDDPYGKRDHWKWRLYLRSLPYYSLVAVIRDENVPEAYAAGARHVLRLDRSADEVAHAPRPLSEEDRRKWSSDVLFVGTWMPERGPFLARLIELGVPLTLHGQGWQKAREWPQLEPFWRSPGLYDDDSYAKAIQCAKVTLGLLSKGNRDSATTRSFEVPLLGGVFCAERTDEHRRLYAEDSEAVFWSTPEECAAKCKLLLEDSDWRAGIARRGRARCVSNGATHQQMLTKVLNEAFSLQGNNAPQLEAAR